MSKTLSRPYWMEPQLAYSLNEFIPQLQEKLYPLFVSGSSQQSLQAHFKELKKLLQALDQVNLKSIIKSQQLIDELIKRLNNLCTYTHRISISNTILEIIGQMTQNLKGLPVGRNQIKISGWNQELQIINLTEYKQTLKNEDQLKLQPTITKILDQLYLQQHRIPHFEHFLLKFPNILFANNCFEQQLLNNSNSCIPLDHKLFLGIIAASTYGCQYIWNRLAVKFRDTGGEMDWLTNGLKSTTIPTRIKILSKLSWELAYDFEKILTDDIIQQIQQVKQTSSSFFLQGLFIISYYQTLSCLSLVSGLVLQERTLVHNYLPISNISAKPSLQSFQAMYLKETKQQVCQNQKALDFFSMFIQEKKEPQQQSLKLLKKMSNKKSSQQWISSGQDNDQDEIYKNARKCGSKATSDDGGYKKRNILSILAEKQAKLQKLKNMRTIENIKLTYGKYLNIQQRQFEKEFQLSKFFKKPRKNSSSSIKEEKLLQVPGQQKSKQIFKSISENSFGGAANVVYASDWTFRQNALTEIQTILGTNFIISLKNILKALRYPHEFTPQKLDNSENGRQEHQAQLKNSIALQPQSGTKARNRKIYYELINNYLYEYVNYPQLINEQVSTIEKNFIKLSTKSPFLFSDKAFKIMNEKMGLSGSKMVEQLLQIISYKLELNISMVTLIILQLSA